jgi:aminomethyltransferase
MSRTIKKLPLYDLQKGLKAIFGNYYGYKVPMSFKTNSTQEVIKGIRNNKVVIFDVSHMGVIKLQDRNNLNSSNNLLEKIFPINTNLLKPNKSKLTILLNKDGYVKDDLIISNISNANHSLVVNASTKDNIFNTLTSYNKDNVDIVLEDKIILAIQGNESETLLMEILGLDLSVLNFNDNLSFHSKIPFSNKLHNLEIIRTGYTGEDGFEIYCDYEFGRYLYKKFIKFKDEIYFGGLIERDILRIESGFCLSGTEFGSNLDIPFSSIDMNFLIGKRRLNDAKFLGANNLDIETQKKRIGFYSKRPLKKGDIIFSKENEIGFITSSTKSYNLDKFISMGYIDQNYFNESIYTKKNNKKIYLEVKKLPFLPHNLRN